MLRTNLNSGDALAVVFAWIIPVMAISNRATGKELLCVKALKRCRRATIAESWGGGMVGAIDAFVDALFICTPPVPERKNIQTLWSTYGRMLPRRAPKIEAILEVAKILYGPDTINALNPQALVDNARKQHFEDRLIRARAVDSGHFDSIRTAISAMGVEGLLLRMLDALLPPYEP